MIQLTYGTSTKIIYSKDELKIISINFAKHAFKLPIFCFYKKLKQLFHYILHHIFKLHQRKCE